MKNKLVEVYTTVGNVLSTGMSEKVFQEIADKNFIIKLVYNVHKILRRTFLGTLMVWFYGFALSLTYRIPKKDKYEIISTAIFKNEIRQINFIEECLGDNRITRIKHSKKYLFSVQFLKNIFGNLSKIRKTYRLMKFVNKKYSFMPACRCSYAIFLYFCFIKDLKSLKPKAVLFANDYSSDAVALSRAAMKLNIPTIYIKHAFLDSVSNRAPLNFDLTFLDGPKELENCMTEENSKSKIVFKGIEVSYSPLRAGNLKQTGMRVGIFLTGLLNLDKFDDLLASIQKNLSPTQILIRQHPNPLNWFDLSSFVVKYNNIKITYDTTLKQDTIECDLAIIGNSTALLEILKVGTPAVYCQLETSSYDICGFIKSGIILEIKNFSEFLAEKIKEFYISKDWTEKFRGYEPYYGENVDVKALVKNEIESLLKKSG